MIKLENFEVTGWEHAIRGMRNPYNSWERSDSVFECPDCDCSTTWFIDEGLFDKKDALITHIGPYDYELMMKLAKGGPVHAKYRRMIAVYVDITAPLYWWKEFDTYKVGTVENSCSTMHKIADKEFTINDFSHELLLDELDMNIPEERWAPSVDKALAAIDVDGNTCYYTPLGFLSMTCDVLNHYRDKYNETKTKPMKDESKRKELLKLYFDQLIQLLPSSYNQKRTVMLNYEVLAGIYPMRNNHKLDEWREFCKWIESLPYSEIITGRIKEDDNYYDSIYGIGDINDSGLISE